MAIFEFNYEMNVWCRINVHYSLVMKASSLVCAVNTNSTPVLLRVISACHRSYGKPQTPAGADRFGAALQTGPAWRPSAVQQASAVPCFEPSTSRCCRGYCTILHEGSERQWSLCCHGTAEPSWFLYLRMWVDCLRASDSEARTWPSQWRRLGWLRSSLESGEGLTFPSKLVGLLEQRESL